MEVAIPHSFSSRSVIGRSAGQALSKAGTAFSLAVSRFLVSTSPMSFTMSKLFSFGEPPKNQHHCFPRFPSNWLSVPHHTLHFRFAHAEYPVVGFLGALKQWFLRAQTQAIVNSLLLSSFTTLVSAAHDANSSLLRAASTAGLGSKHIVTTQLELLGMRSERAVSVNFGVAVVELLFVLFH